MMTFDQVRCGALSVDKRWMGRVLALDPGETTGVTVMDAFETTTQLINQQQVKTWPLEHAVENLTQLLDTFKPNVVVFERYAVYEWKKDQHSWSEIPTIQVIGVIQTLCIQRKIPRFSQTAQIAKQFVTDQKLEAWGLYKKGQKHSRDATRHACYYVLFGKRP